MVKRSVNSPWGNVYKEGLPSTAVDDKTEVDQEVRPTINTGSIDVRTGKWEGVTHSDENFKDFTTHLAIPNGAAVLAPATATRDYIDMTGFSDLFIAIKPSNGGNFAIEAVMGPDTNTFANLTPVVSALGLRGCFNGIGSEHDLELMFKEDAEPLTADGWNILIIEGRLKDQKNMQFKITNGSGGESNIEFAYLRVV